MADDDQAAWNAVTDSDEFRALSPADQRAIVELWDRNPGARALIRQFNTLDPQAQDDIVDLIALIGLDPDATRDAQAIYRADGDQAAYLARVQALIAQFRHKH